MGKILVAMVNRVLDSQRAINHCRAENCGAEILFMGTVRNTNEGKSVKAVNYDGHRRLGENILSELCREAQSKWGNEMNLWVEHRLGLVKVGEESLLIHVTSPHRASAYQASRYLIEQIKLRLPVWKEEIYSEGDAQWLSGQALNKI